MGIFKFPYSGERIETPEGQQPGMFRVLVNVHTVGTRPYGHTQDYEAALYDKDDNLIGVGTINIPASGIIPEFFLKYSEILDAHALGYEARIVNDTGLVKEYPFISAFQDLEEIYADINNPVFTGTPLVPTYDVEISPSLTVELNEDNGGIWDGAAPWDTTRTLAANVVWAKGWLGVQNVVPIHKPDLSYFKNVLVRTPDDQAPDNTIVTRDWVSGRVSDLSFPSNNTVFDENTKRAKRSPSHNANTILTIPEADQLIWAIKDSFLKVSDIPSTKSINFDGETTIDAPVTAGGLRNLLVSDGHILAKNSGTMVGPVKAAALPSSDRSKKAATAGFVRDILTKIPVSPPTRSQDISGVADWMPVNGATAVAMKNPLDITETVVSISWPTVVPRLVRAGARVRLTKDGKNLFGTMIDAVVMRFDNVLDAASEHDLSGCGIALTNAMQMPEFAYNYYNWQNTDFRAPVFLESSTPAISPDDAIATHGMLEDLIGSDIAAVPNGRFGLNMAWQANEKERSSGIRLSPGSIRVDDKIFVIDQFLFVPVDDTIVKAARIGFASCHWLALIFVHATFRNDSETSRTYEGIQPIVIPAGYAGANFEWASQVYKYSTVIVPDSIRSGVMTAMWHVAQDVMQIGNRITSLNMGCGIFSEISKYSHDASLPSNKFSIRVPLQWSSPYPYVPHEWKCELEAEMSAQIGPFLSTPGGSGGRTIPWYTQDGDAGKRPDIWVETSAMASAREAFGGQVKPAAQTFLFGYLEADFWPTKESNTAAPDPRFNPYLHNSEGSLKWYPEQSGVMSVSWRQNLYIGGESEINFLLGNGWNKKDNPEAKIVCAVTPYCWHMQDMYLSEIED